MEKLISTEMMASVQTGMCVLRKDDAMDDNGEIIITQFAGADAATRLFCTYRFTIGTNVLDMRGCLRTNYSQCYYSN